MKRCPTCQRTYPDDAPAFCVNDGTRLVDDVAQQEYDPQKTILSSVPLPSPASPPPQQYSSPAPPPVQPPTQQPPPPQQQQQPVWPPQPQAQNWGGYQQQPAQYQNYPQPYAAPAPGGKGLTLPTFILGLISALALGLVFAMAREVITLDLDVLQIAYYGSAGTGVIALILGILSMISRRQRSKWMAIVGMVLALPGILFFIYVQFIR